MARIEEISNTEPGAEVFHAYWAKQTPYQGEKLNDATFLKITFGDGQQLLAALEKGWKESGEVLITSVPGWRIGVDRANPDVFKLVMTPTDYILMESGNPIPVVRSQTLDYMNEVTRGLREYAGSPVGAALGRGAACRVRQGGRE